MTCYFIFRGYPRFWRADGAKDRVSKAYSCIKDVKA